jgi:hypothetical protein
MANKYKQEKKNSPEIQVGEGRKCTHPQKRNKQESAKRCAEARAKRTNQEQLNLLDKILGKNKGAKKERERLQLKIAQAKKAPNKNKKHESDKQKGSKKIHA